MTQSKTEAAKAETKASTTAPRQRKAVPKTKPAGGEASIYIGPNLPDGQLTRTTLFKAGKMPAHVQELVKQCPALKSLIVPVSKLGAAEAKLKQTSSVERSRFQEVRKHFYKGAN